MTKRLFEIETEPEIGRYYLVPCVRMIGGSIEPVIGSEHEDSEYIGLTIMHWHRDLRFTHPKTIAAVVEETEMRINTKGMTDEQVCLASILPHSIYVGERKMICRRKMTIFSDSKIFHWRKSLEDGYKGKSLNCLHCPHRGIRLSPESADESGNVVCPGHGLQWNLKTGRLVSRLK